LASSPQTVPAALARAAERFGEREAVVDGETRFTYAELHSRTLDFARFLSSEGLQPGDRVALCSPNTWHWVVAALGALSAGATLVPVSTRFTDPEIRDILDRCQAKAFLVADEFLGVDRLAEASKPSPPITVRIPLASRSAAWDIRGRTATIPEVHADDVCDILFTSGTTGRSKGAMSCHHQSLGVAEAWADCAALTEADRYLVLNPFFHSFGYKAGILAALLRGSTLVPQAVFDAEETLRLIESERITVLPGAPAVYRMLLDHPARAARDLSSLRLAVTGAATVPVSLVDSLYTQLGFDTVLTAYGLTEAVVATMCRPDDDVQTVARTCGRAAAGFEVAIGEREEVLLRGPNVMLGYLDDPSATAEAIDEHGWLHTGDVGVLDEHGYLTITDRLKDMYICGGFNVYPAEVEQTLATLDGVAESAVIGVPDERLGEVGKAYIVLRAGSRLSVEDILAHCKQNLANYKLPRSVELPDALPRNPSGKVVKRILREEFR
jgi:acyl-CoA synthetase (AMP-forming)/AMP-acid ligase II